MGSALTYSGVTLYPKGGNRSSKCLPVQTEWEATRLFSFFLALCFLSDSPISWLCGASGVGLCQQQELKAPQISLWD